MLEAASYRGRPPNSSRNFTVVSCVQTVLSDKQSNICTAKSVAEQPAHVLSPNHRSARASMPSYSTLSWRDSVRLRKKSSLSTSSTSTTSEHNQTSPWNDENLNSYAPWNTPPTAFPWGPLANGNCTNSTLSPSNSFNRQSLEGPPTLSSSKSHLSGVYQSQQLEPPLPTLSTSKSHLSDVCLTLDPKYLVPHNGTSKYHQLRESPTPPKSKKKCMVERGSGVKETRFGPTSYCPDSFQAEISRVNSALELQRRLSGEMDQHHGRTKSNLKKSARDSNGHNYINSQPLSNHKSSKSSFKCGGKNHKNANRSKSPNIPPTQFDPCYPTNIPYIDRCAFERYYEGIKLCDECPPALPRKDAHGAKKRGCASTGHVDCGGFTPFSLALTIPAKLEGLLKLLAQSLHLVLSGFCSRKARRKDKDAPAAEQEHKLYLEDSVLERKIPETDLRQLVELPAGLGYHEWLASHTIDFFQHINLVYGTIAEFCTLSGCSDMSGPCTRPYLWFDEKGKKVRVAAPQYIDYVMTFTQKTINDETIFPTKFENEFPGSFESIVKKIHRLLFHVIAHLYHSHFRELVVLSLHAHLNCIFAHFTLFNERFSLIDEKETEILHDLVLALRLHPSEGGSKEPEEDSTDVNDEDPSEDGPEEPQNSSVPGHADPNTSNSLVQSGAKSAATSSSNNSAPFLSPENSSSTTAAKP